MKKLMATAAIAAVLGLGARNDARASGVPVVDAAALAQMVTDYSQMLRDYEQQIQQVTHLADQLDNMRQQLDQARRQFESITGPRGLADFLDSTVLRTERTAASSLGAIERAVAAGEFLTGANTSVLTDRIDELTTRLELSDLTDLMGSDIPQERSIATLAAAGIAAAATAEDTYDRANKSMERVNTYIDAIDDNADLKASVDYNTRVMAEVAQLLNEGLRLQAAAANAQGAAAVTDARAAARSRGFMQATTE